MNLSKEFLDQFGLGAFAGIFDLFFNLLLLFFGAFILYTIWQSDSKKKKFVKDKDGYWVESPMTVQEIESEKNQYTINSESEKYYNPNFSHLVKKEKPTIQHPSSSFDNFIAGRISLAKMFWLYFMFIGIIISTVSGYISGLGYPIIIIIPLAYYTLISVALWNCATIYKNNRLANRQSYGWAIGVKIIIILNIVMLIMQALLN
jgi:Flp pilus assembly protein TadB